MTTTTRSNPSSSILLLLAIPALLGMGKPSAPAKPMTSLIPGDALVLYAAKPYSFLTASSPQTTTSSAAESPGVSISAIVSFLNAAGLIPGEGQVYADIVSALPLLGRFEHAVTLLDVSTKMIDRREDAGADAVDDVARIILRLDRLQAAIIFRTGDDDDVVLEQLNRAISRYTNRDVAKLSTHEAEGFKYQRLVDDRLKAWAIWEWGRIDDCFVIGFGEGAFDRIAAVRKGRQESMQDNDWYRRASSKAKSDASLAHWFLAFAGLRDRLGEVASGRVANVTAALQASDMTHDLWTIGREGRALTVRRCYRRAGEDVVRSYSEPSAYSERLLKIVPTDAKRIAIVNVPTKWLVDNLPRAWVASQSESNIHKWQTVWERLNKEKGIDISANLIDHLGDHIVFFDYPEHPLKIPFALTVAIEINAQKPVKIATDALLDAWGQYLDDRAERNKTVLVRVNVKHDDDGVWYLQAGILGPAMKVTDRFLVLSWSPQALRDALRYIESQDATGNRP